MSLDSNLYLDELNLKTIPSHIAIIMDGNGRWAKRQKKTRLTGHNKGVLSVKKIVKAAIKANIKYLTLYVFSDENWNRPKQEISGLFNLLSITIDKQIKDLVKNDVKLKHIGDLSLFPKNLEKKINNAVKQTKNNTGLTLCLAIGYGAKNDIINAVNKIIHQKQNNTNSFTIKEEDITHNLSTHGMPDPELLIRTSGEQRISNFLLWQIAYSELYFSNKLWPEFNEEDLYKAILDYQKRERRFGLISEQLND